MSTSEPLWTIGELGALVARALSVGYAGQANGQVRDVPDSRTIRYYTTLGLVDRPEAMRGRTALYGRRHLMQVVAIKRLQAAGKSLGEIQQSLLGLTATALSQLAKLPDNLETVQAAVPETAEASHSGQARSARPFWSAPPAPVSTEPVVDAASLVQTLQSIQLAPGAALVLTTNEPIPTEALQSIRDAAEPLLRLLEAQGLMESRHERGM